MRDLILNALRESVREYPELFDYLKDDAARVVIIDELNDWRKACATKGTAYIAHIPDALKDMTNQMLSYADCPDCMNQVFDDVIAFLKQEDGNPADWHEKVNPVIGKLESIDYDIVDSEITQEDIDEAVKRWDKMMPEYKGMLDAKIEGVE